MRGYIGIAIKSAQERCAKRGDYETVALLTTLANPSGRDAAEGAAKPTCETCGGIGLIGGFEPPDGHRDDPCPDCNPAATPQPAPSLDKIQLQTPPDEKPACMERAKEVGGQSHVGLTPISALSPQPAPDAMRSVDAFDLGFAWAWGLRGQSVEDSRAVGRTLQSDLFARLNIDLEGFNSFQSADAGIVEAKRRIKAALSAPVPPADGALLPCDVHLPPGAAKQ